MNGPEHYVEAERLLQPPTGTDKADYGYPTSSAERAALAQVHATLALAAATAAAQASAYDGDETNARSRGWAGVA